MRANMKKQDKNLKFPRWIVVLKTLFEKEELNVAQLHKKTDITYSYICVLIHRFKQMKWIKVKEVGRMKKIRLTKEGKELAKISHELIIKRDRYLDNETSNI
jgi:DNA-binding MarR family transcriptional regulator